MDWYDFANDGPEDGRMILAWFADGEIECRCEAGGCHTRDDRLIVDAFGLPAEPVGWLPLGAPAG